MTAVFATIMGPIIIYNYPDDDEQYIEANEVRRQWEKLAADDAVWLKFWDAGALDIRVDLSWGKKVTCDSIRKAIKECVDKLRVQGADPEGTRLIERLLEL